MAREETTVRILNNDYYRRQTSNNGQKLAGHFEKKHRRKMKILLFFAICLTLLCSGQIVKNQLHTRRINAQAQVAQQKLQDQTKQSQGLKLQVKQLKDPAYLQKYIRERYYYSKNHEIIYNLPTDSSTSVTNGS